MPPNMLNQACDTCVPFSGRRLGPAGHTCRTMALAGSSPREAAVQQVTVMSCGVPELGHWP